MVKVKDDWQLRVAGKGTDLPAGTVIDFQIRWRTFVVFDFKIELDGSRRIDEKIILKNLRGALSGCQLRSEIVPASQSRDVQSAMSKNPKQYPIETAPWKQSFWRQKFDIGDAKALEKAKVVAREFFLVKTRKVLSLQRAFEAAKTEAADVFKSQGNLIPSRGRNSAKQTFVKKSANCKRTSRQALKA